MKKKSLNAKKTIARNFNFKKILNDKKIFEIYRNFVKNFENLNNPGKIAVAVSGGPDSMALCFLISCYKFQKNKKITPLGQGGRGKYKLFQNSLSRAPYAIFNVFPILFL